MVGRRSRRNKKRTRQAAPQGTLRNTCFKHSNRRCDQGLGGGREVCRPGLAQFTRDQQLEGQGVEELPGQGLVVVLQTRQVDLPGLDLKGGEQGGSGILARHQGRLRQGQSRGQVAREFRQAGADAQALAQRGRRGLGPACMAPMAWAAATHSNWASRISTASPSSAARCNGVALRKPCCTWVWACSKSPC